MTNNKLSPEIEEHFYRFFGLGDDQPEWVQEMRDLINGKYIPKSKVREMSSCNKVILREMLSKYKYEESTAEAVKLKEEAVEFVEALLTPKK